MFASCVLIVRLTRCAGWVPQDQLLATVNGRSQLATLWRCCSGLTTRVMRAPRPCYLFPPEAAEGNSSEHIWVFQKIWALKIMEAPTNIITQMDPYGETSGVDARWTPMRTVRTDLFQVVCR